MKLRLRHPVRRGNDQADARLGLIPMTARDDSFLQRTHDSPLLSGDEANNYVYGATEDAPIRRFHCSAKDDKKQGWRPATKPSESGTNSEQILSLSWVLA
jgi:hypothetical protein